MRDAYRNAMAIFINQVLPGEPVTAYGNGQQVSAFSYAGDIVPLFDRAATSPEARPGVFNERDEAQ
jgi:UDP-glucose 4-epimerase